jgi:predicted MFS family arabinose efflux permease
MEKQVNFLGHDKETWVLFALRTMNSVSFSASLPFFGIYLLEVRGVSLAIIGGVYFITGVLGLGSQVLGGRLTDALGPKKVMLSGYLMSLITVAIIGYLVLMNANVIIFYIVYPIFSLLRGISQPATASIIAGHEGGALKSGFNLLTIGGNLGFAIGPAIGGFVAAAYGYAVVFFLSSAVTIPVILLALSQVRGGLRYSSDQLRVSPAKIKKWLTWREDRNILIFLILTMASYLAIGYEINPLSLYVADFLNFSPDLIGYLFATNGLVIVLLQIPIIKLADRSTRIVLPLIISPLLAFAAFMIASASSTFLQFEVVMVVITLGEILLTVPSQTIIAFFSRPGNRGVYQGYYYAMSNFGRSLAAFVGPSSFELLAFDPKLAWYAIGAVALVISLAFGILSPRLQKDYEKQKLSSSVEN